MRLDLAKDAAYQPSDASAARANALVRAYALRDFHATYGHYPHHHVDDDDAAVMAGSWPSGHLIGCPEAHVLDGDGEDGAYGCTTGCEYWRITAVVTCPHGARFEHHVGDFGDLEGLIVELEHDAVSRAPRVEKVLGEA